MPGGGGGGTASCSSASAYTNVPGALGGTVSGSLLSTPGGSLSISEVTTGQMLTINYTASCTTQYFEFPTKLSSGTSWSVSASNTSGGAAMCSVTSGATGSMGAVPANAYSVVISCN